MARISGEGIVAQLPVSWGAGVSGLGKVPADTEKSVQKEQILALEVTVKEITGLGEKPSPWMRVCGIL